MTEEVFWERGGWGGGGVGKSMGKYGTDIRSGGGGGGV